MSHREIVYSIAVGGQRIDGAWVDDVDAAYKAFEEHEGPCRIVGNFMAYPDDTEAMPRLLGFTAAEK